MHLTSKSKTTKISKWNFTKLKRTIYKHREGKILGLKRVYGTGENICTLWICNRLIYKVHKEFLINQQVLNLATPLENKQRIYINGQKAHQYAQYH